MTLTAYGEVKARSFYVYRLQGLPIPILLLRRSSPAAIADRRSGSFVRSVVPVPSFVIA